jgi:hypothetical protein
MAAIEYVIHKSTLSTLTDAYTASVCAGQPVDMEEIIERIAEHDSTVSKPDVLCVLEDFFSAVERFLIEGRNVNTPLASFRVSIKGLFNGLNDAFDPTRHRIVPRVSPGPRLRKVVDSRAEALKQEEAGKRSPRPNEYVDVNTGAHDSTLTSGGMGQILGHRLSFDPADPQQGIFFVAADSSASRVQIVGRNRPSELMFTVPVLAPGSYTLEVRAILNDNHEVRSGRLEAALLVA